MFCDKIDVENSQRVPPFSFFQHCETFFPEKKFPQRVPLHFFAVLRQNGCWKIPKGVPLSVIFGIVRLFSKLFFHRRVPNSPILWHIEVLLLFLSLRNGADLGRSRLVFYLQSKQLHQYCIFTILLYLLYLLYIYIYILSVVISELYCILLRRRRRFENKRSHLYQHAITELLTFYPSELCFFKEEAYVWKYCAMCEFWRYIRSKLRFDKEEVNFRFPFSILTKQSCSYIYFRPSWKRRWSTRTGPWSRFRTRSLAWASWTRLSASCEKCTTRSTTLTPSTCPSRTSTRCSGQVTQNHSPRVGIEPSTPWLLLAVPLLLFAHI